ncbi:MAG: ATP-binding protein [Veillonellaceae bacterium]|nr:ATP-binding protein [Veillonellaceae bacterium]
MWLAIKQYHEKLKKLRHSLSVRLTLVYVGIMLLISLFTTFLAIGSVHYLLMRQLQVDVRVSARQTLLHLDYYGRMDASVFHGQNILRDVQLIVYDDDGEPLMDNITRYEKGAPLPLSQRKIIRATANSELFEVDETPEDLSYRYLKYWQASDGTGYYLQFVRNAARERHFIYLLIRQILITLLASLVVMFLAGVAFTREVLSPLRAMKEPLRRIEVNELGYRVPLPENRDELYDLATTLNRALDRLESGVAQQQQFVSDASHELRTPITVIQGYTDLLIRWGARDEETLQESLDAIRAETEYMRMLIEQLLYVARASAGAVEIHRRVLDVSELIREVWRGVEITNTPPNAHRCVLEANEPALLLADESMFKQLLRIFIDNARKYTPAGKGICLAGRRQGDRYVISVRDEGVGIPEADFERIFTRFYRVDSSRTRATGGTGLGLAIAKDIVDRHDGKISVESVLGEGSVFSLDFPLAAEDEDE